MSTYATPPPNSPGAAGYQQASLLAQKAYDNAMSRYQQQRSSTLLGAGYVKNADGSYGVDANNEYGGYQTMLHNEGQQTQGLERQQAASGWGGSSGFLGQQRENLAHAQGGEQAQFGRTLADQLAGIDQGEQGASYDKDAALYQALQNATETNIAAGNYNPGAVPPADSTAGEPVPKVAPLRKATAVHTAGKQQILNATKKKAVRR